ncbi:MAG: aldose 1-epimerase family protein, partial [Lacrimispora sp.]
MNYQLKNDDLSVELTTKGGALTSIRDMSGREYLWQGDPKYWSGQAPVLFPICGSLREDRAVTEDGKPVYMPRHGMVRKEEFRLESVSKDSICFSIGENESMLARYPYKFRLFLTYLLKGKNIQVTYGILNEGTVAMPFFIGGHPAFNCPLDRGEEYSDYLIVF